LPLENSCSPLSNVTVNSSNTENVKLTQNIPKTIQNIYVPKSPVAQICLQHVKKPVEKPIVQNLMQLPYHPISTETEMEIEEIPVISEPENILATEKNDIIVEEVVAMKLEHTENELGIKNFENDGIACINCEQYYSDEFELINHIQETDKCQNAVRLIGLKYCLVCQKSYQSVRDCKNLLYLCQ
jgi:hypothetical protein